jgi:Tectonin domain
VIYVPFDIPTMEGGRGPLSIQQHAASETTWEVLKQAGAVDFGDDAPLENFVQVWGLNVRPRNPGDLFTFHDIFRFDLGTGQFEQIPGELLIIAASAGDVWGINAFHDVFRFDSQARVFVPVPGQQLDAIAVGINDVWGLSSSQLPPH